jgi:hypothetical protein
MGAISEHYPVLLIAGISSRYQRGLQWSIEQAQRTWGPIAKLSPAFDFSETRYYTASMGSDLKKQFVAFERLIDPASIADTKHLSNRWEAEFKQQNDYVEERPVNIDPGYITEAKLVLVTTKDRDHRLYLRDGIYAEVTLHFRGKGWESSRWTYPDYQRADYQAFFTECRHWLRSRLKGISDSEPA